MLCQIGQVRRQAKTARGRKRSRTESLATFLDKYLQCLAVKGFSELTLGVLFAKSGREAIDIFAQHQPSLVITDWMMPDFSGIELCENIRQYFQESYTYIIIFTGMTEKSEVVKGLTAGADDYLTKQFDREELLARTGVGRRVVELHRQIEAKIDF